VTGRPPNAPPAELKCTAATPTSRNSRVRMLSR